MLSLGEPPPGLAGVLGALAAALGEACDLEVVVFLLAVVLLVVVVFLVVVVVLVVGFVVVGFMVTPAGKDKQNKRMVFGAMKSL